MCLSAALSVVAHIAERLPIFLIPKFPAQSYGFDMVNTTAQAATLIAQGIQFAEQGTRPAPSLGLVAHIHVPAGVPLFLCLFPRIGRVTFWNGRHIVNLKKGTPKPCVPFSTDR